MTELDSMLLKSDWLSPIFIYKWSESDYRLEWAHLISNEQVQWEAIEVTVFASKRIFRTNWAINNNILDWQCKWLKVIVCKPI